MKVFISYSHSDIFFVNEFKRHAGTLKNIEFWDDSKISPGQRWRSEIDHALENCSTAILFISADFLTSEFIMENEVPIILKGVENGTIRLLNVIVKPCLFDQYQELNSIQAVNSPSKTVLQMTEVEREVFWSNLARTVKNA